MQVSAIQVNERVTGERAKKNYFFFEIFSKSTAFCFFSTAKVLQKRDTRTYVHTYIQGYLQDVPAHQKSRKSLDTQK